MKFLNGLRVTILISLLVFACSFFAISYINPDINPNTSQKTLSDNNTSVQVAHSITDKDNVTGSHSPLDAQNGHEYSGSNNIVYHGVSDYLFTMMLICGLIIVVLVIFLCIAGTISNNISHRHKDTTILQQKKLIDDLLKKQP